jgi:MFS family permease
MPLVPVFADDMGVNALLAGVLSGASGLGMMIGSFAWAAWPVQRRGLLYLVGCVLAMAFLFTFAAIQWYPAALVLLIGAGFGSSAFGTMQGVLVMTTAQPEMRGRAMGVLSMAIGSLPFGMIGLGLIAQATDPALAVMISVAAGFLVVAVWTVRYSEMRVLR